MWRLNQLGDRVADWITEFSGSWIFLGLHFIWWGVWKVLSLPIDDLTLWVSLEAIVLGVFVLMSQNRTAQRDRQLIEAILAATTREEAEIEQIEATLLVGDQ